MKVRIRWLVGLAALVAVLAGCGGQQTAPTPAPVGHGTIVGYTRTTGEHVTNISLHDKPAGSPGPGRSLGSAREGDRVAILVQNADGTVKVRTPDGIEGWTQIDFVKIE